MEDVTSIEFINVMCNFIVAVCSVIGLAAIFIAKAEYKHNKSKESAEKAIDMAKYFMDEILPGLSLINKLCEDNGIGELLNKYKFYEYDDFDSDELHNLFSENEIKRIVDVFKNTDIPNDLACESENNKEKSIKLKLLSAILLNKLEYMCMYIASEVADGEYIYNSLHQMFLSSDQTLYVNIARLNVNEKDKYYTNIIEVYNQWKERYFVEAEREERLSQELEQKIREVKKNFKKSKKIS